MNRQVKIAALAVSLDRLDEIKGCVAALRAQERPVDRIIVVDNSSTDGSAEWLDAQADVHTIHQPNLGMSGGLRTGLQYALANGFDWVWLLDDDAHPLPDALAALCRAIQARPDGRVFNSMGMSRVHPTRFAVGALRVRLTSGIDWHGHVVTSLDAARAYADAHGIVNTIGGHFYQGVLIHRSVLEDAGMPLPWLFLCGEEIEFGMRIMRAGYPIYGVLDSLAMHPEIPHAALHLFGRTKEFNVRSPSRRYLFLRNSMWIHRTYFRDSPLSLYAARRLGGAFLAELFVIPNRTWRQRLEACTMSVRGIFDGLRLRAARDAAGNEILS